MLRKILLFYLKRATSMLQLIMEMHFWRTRIVSDMSKVIST